MLPKGATMRDREQRNVLLSAIFIHGILDVDADSTRAFVQNRELRFMIKQPSHLYKKIKVIKKYFTSVTLI